MTTGISEKVQVIDETSTDRTNLLGLYQTGTFTFPDTEEEAERSIDSGGKPVEIRDGAVDFPLSLTFKPTTLEALRLMGTYSTFNSGSKYRINFPENESLPELDFVRMQFIDNANDTGYYEASNVKVGEFVLGVESNDVVTIEFPTMFAKDGKIVEGSTVNVSSNDGVPLQWSDAEVKIGGSTVGVVDSVNQSVNRNLSSEHYITSDTGASARKPDLLEEGNYEMLPSIVVRVTNLRAFREAVDDGSGDLEIQSSKSYDNVELAFGGKAGSLIFTDGKFEIDEYELDEDKDTRTVELSGESLDVKVEGDT